MLRILSVLLVLFGLVVAGFGGAALMEQYTPKEAASAAAAPGAVETAAVEAAPEEPAFDVASVEPEPEMSAESAAEGAVPDAVAEAGPALSEEESQFNFQTQMEPAPMARSAPPESAGDGALPEISAMSAPAQPSFEDRLQTVPVAHETPLSAEYKRAFDVTFAIDATGDTTAADALPGKGLIEEGEAKVSERVEVRLSGANFDIVATSPPVQSLSPLTENTWRWSVTALSAGEHDLTFEVFAIDTDAVTPLRTYRDTVTVKVSGLNRAIAFVTRQTRSLSFWAASARPWRASLRPSGSLGTSSQAAGFALTASLRRAQIARGRTVHDTPGYQRRFRAYRHTLAQACA